MKTRTMKTFYGTQGNGHITNAKVMAKELYATGCDVITFQFTEHSEDEYFDINLFNGFQLRTGLAFNTEKGAVNYLKTARDTQPIRFIKDIKSLDLSGYDLVISDFEPIPAWASKKKNKKVPILGVIVHYLALKEEITDHKQNEAIILLAKEKAEALAKSKTQFLANMSHEIRTPMNGIIGFSELALLKEMPTDIRDYLSKINSASTNLLSILNDILDLSKLEANGISLNPVLFDLDELRDTLYALFTETTQNKGLVFNIKISAQVPRKLIGDDLRLKQVLINLLSNAIKFTDSGVVSLDISLLNSDSSKAKLLFSVKDSGIGLSVQDQEKLFQPFSQANDSISHRFGGTGLGLSLSHNLVHLMGGEFTVLSTLGLGSCFSFELVLGVPAISSSDKVKHPVATATALKNFSPMLTGTRILVAEDNFFNQQIVLELLKLAGIQVEIANNGAEALAILERSHFDAILMDVHMPVMDGLEATHEIRRSLCFANIPVIALTAGVTKEEREQCLAYGMNDFINKPINMTQLLSTLVRWIKK